MTDALDRDDTPSTVKRPWVQTLEVMVNVVTPEMTPDYHIFGLTVRWYGEDRWAIVRHHQYLDREGSWSWRNCDDDEWREAHFFSYDEAISIAQRVAPTIKIGPNSAADVAAGRGRYWTGEGYEAPKE